MKIEYKPTPDLIKKARRTAYLATYPVEVQLEALTEAAQDRPEKLNDLVAGLSSIRKSFPYAREDE